MVAAVALATGVTMSVFSDTETVEGNTFATGTIDLTVGGQNDLIDFKFTADNVLPGETVNGGTVTLKNEGTADGSLTVMVSNPVSNENGESEPELSAGDIADQEVDPTGYDANGGNGELWDMGSLTIYFDMNKDGVMQWDEPTVATAVHLDMTTGGGFRILLDTNLWTPNHGFDGILSPGETVDLGVLFKFKDDSQLASQPQYNGLNNNMAMGDDVQFDLIVGLEQVTP